MPIEVDLLIFYRAIGEGRSIERDGLIQSFATALATCTQMQERFRESAVRVENDTNRPYIESVPTSGGVILFKFH